MGYKNYTLLFLLLAVTGSIALTPAAIARVPSAEQTAPRGTPAPLALTSVPASQYKRYRVGRATTSKARTEIAATGARIEQITDEVVIVLATPRQVERLRAKGYRVRQFNYGAPDPAYHSYDEMVSDVQAVAAAHPEIVQLSSIGTSYEGRPLWMAKISDNVAVDEDEPEALFIGHYHGREHLTVEMLLYILHMLADEYGQPGSEQIIELVNAREVWLVFDMNPDGGEFDTSGDTYALWRKNRQPNENTSCVGTDPNRNHSYRWNTPGTSASPNPCDETYRGPVPASAPEVAAMEAFVNSRVVSGTQQIKVAITFHTYSELVLWPYGYTTDDVPEDMEQEDHDVFVAMGEAMAATNGYRAEQSSDLYPSSGDFTDWAYGQHRIFAYTFEMYPNPRTSNEGFYPPGSLIARETVRNREAVLYLLNNAACPYAVIGKSETCAAVATSQFLLPMMKG